MPSAPRRPAVIAAVTATLACGLLVLRHCAEGESTTSPKAHPHVVAMASPPPGAAPRPAAEADPYADTSNIGLSLWLVPAEPAREELAALIASTRDAHRHEGVAAEKDFPLFAPHITVGFWDRDADEGAIHQHAAELAGSTPELTATFDAVDAGDRFFQCVYARARKDAALVHPNAATQHAFGWNYEYMPHLSLAYANVPREARDAIASDLSGVLAGRAVRLDALELWDTSGPVESWALVQRFPLQPA